MVAEAIAQAVQQFDPALILVGLAGSELIAAGEAAGLAIANEGFPDRAYLPDGSLMPRGQQGAVITAPDAVAANALELVQEGIVITMDTLCLHGDNLRAVANAKAVRAALEAAGIAITRLA
jgi:UPF0271 protein